MKIGGKGVREGEMSRVNNSRTERILRGELVVLYHEQCELGQKNHQVGRWYGKIGVFWGEISTSSENVKTRGD